MIERQEDMRRWSYCLLRWRNWILYPLLLIGKGWRPNDKWRGKGREMIKWPWYRQASIIGSQCNLCTLSFSVSFPVTVGKQSSLPNILSKYIFFFGTEEKLMPIYFPHFGITIWINFSCPSESQISRLIWGYTCAGSQETNSVHHITPILQIMKRKHVYNFMNYSLSRNQTIIPSKNVFSRVTFWIPRHKRGREKNMQAF